MFGLKDKITGIIGGAMAFAMIGLLVALLITRGALADRTEQRDTLQHWQDNVRAVTSSAADVRDKKGNPALLAAGQVPLQIVYLGDNLAECHTSLNNKNAESKRRGEALADATASYEATIARLEKEGAGRAERLAYWQGMAQKYQADGACPIPEELRKELNR